MKLIKPSLLLIILIIIVYLSISNESNKKNLIFVFTCLLTSLTLIFYKKGISEFFRKLFR
jgi:hypothetical protein